MCQTDIAAEVYRHALERVRRRETVAALFAMALACGVGPATAALTDLSTTPLQTATPLVKPNLLFILDDSGSMGWDFMPDWAESGGAELVRNSGYNATYYNPAIRYRPPTRADGSEYPSMSSATTSAWTKVPFDGFGVQNARDTGTNLFTNSNSGTTQNLVGNAFYYVFIPKEFCSAPDLKKCVRQDKASTDYAYPAMLRWCNTANASDCRATRIEAAQRGGLAYTNYRAPGLIAQGSLTLVPGSNTRVNIVSARNSYGYPNDGSSTEVKADARDDCIGSTCTYAEEMTNFANWWAYYRTRMQMAKSAASLAFQDVDTKFRIGYMTINNNTGGDFLNVLDVDTSATGQKYQWYTKLLAAEPGSSTPLRTALSNAGKYFAGKTTTINKVSTTDPMQYACQRNYTLLSTDGYWNDNATPTTLTGVAIGDQDGLASVTAPYKDGNAVTNTLSDIAQYYFVTDIRSTAFGNTSGALRSDVADNNVPDTRQTMRTSTIGLGASGQMQYRDDYKTATSGDYADIAKGVASTSTACDWQTTSGACTWPKPVSNEQTTIDDLWHAAVNGRGTYYSAADPEQLKKGLKDFISEVARGAALQLTPPSVSNLNLTETDNISFSTTFTSGGWFGDVRAETLNAATAAKTGVVLWSQSEPQDSAGGTRTKPILDARDFSTRQIYSYEPSATTSGKMIEFKWTGSGTVPAMGDETRRHFRVTAMTSLTQFCNSGGSSCLPSGDRIDTDNAGAKGAGGANLVNFLRGDRSLEGTSSGRYYRERAHVLGDVVDAKPVYVRAPVFSYTDSGYIAYRSSKSSRTPMVYVAANDGMLHAFQAANGVEAWAYVPSLVLPNMYKLADRDYANRHVFYINATPHTGDVFTKDGGWRTILVGGLGQGGRGYYALDITDAEKQPKVLWEFTHDKTRSGKSYVIDEDLGYSYGKPVITKLADNTWVVIVASGYNNVSPGTGRGYIWVLDALTGQVIRKIDTGVGSTTVAQPGCTALPCPAGLAHIAGFSVDPDRNNVSLRVYGGDLLGNVWRIDISKLTKTGGTTQVTKLATLADAAGNVQPVTARPALGEFGGYPTVFLGTGRYLGQSDIGTTTQQSFYALKDPLTTGVASVYSKPPRELPCSATIKSSCFVKQVLTESSKGIRTASSTVSYAVDFKTMSGWFIDLPKTSERAVSGAELVGAVLAFTSGIPTVSAPCTLGGSSATNIVDARTGLALPGETTVGYLNTSNSGPGGGVTLVVTTTGDLRVISSEGVSEAKKPPSIGGNARLSWRELIIDQ